MKRRLIDDQTACSNTPHYGIYSIKDDELLFCVSFLSQVEIRLFSHSCKYFRSIIERSNVIKYELNSKYSRIYYDIGTGSIMITEDNSRFASIRKQVGFIIVIK